MTIKNQESAICVGYDDSEKKRFVKEFLVDNPDIDGILYFSPTGMQVLDLDWTGVRVMRKTFFEAMCFKHATEIGETVNDRWLIIYDECMRVKKRKDITYNSFHRYGHMVKYQIVFETFPMIDSPDDFLLLVDLAYPDRYVQSKFTPDLLKLPSVDIKPRRITIESVPVPIDEDSSAEYAAERDSLFDGLGRRDPQTVPNSLEIWVGKYKKPYIESDGVYIARNSRYKKPNVKKYTDYNVYDNESYNTMSYETHAKNEYVREFDTADVVTAVDLPVRHKDFVNMVKFSGAKTVRFLNTGLSIDRALLNEYQEIFNTMNEVFYEKNTSI